uniref:Uncharacterized protein n=1 Tax=Taeniopygia guttata TaxID=59729 RepID=H0ZSG0_TAEGU
IIQSSQPSSLKFTCRGFLLQRVFAFFPWPLPPDRAAMVVLLFLRFRNASWPGSGGSRNGGLPRALILSRISLKRFSFLWVREKATSRARSWGCGRGLPKPSCRGGRSCPEPSEAILSTKHSSCPDSELSLRSRKASRTSNTSHLEEPVSKTSAALESSSRGSSPSRLGQVPRRRWWKEPSGDSAKLRFSGRERRIRSSAAVTSSASGRLEMSKRYRCSEADGEASGRDNTEGKKKKRKKKFKYQQAKPHLNLCSTLPSPVSSLSPTSASSLTHIHGLLKILLSPRR